MRNRIEVEQVENGYKVVVWKVEDSEGETHMYPEPKTFVATDEAEVLDLVKKNL
jgi:hypothetical protein